MDAAIADKLIWFILSFFLQATHSVLIIAELEVGALHFTNLIDKKQARASQGKGNKQMTQRLNKD